MATKHILKSTPRNIVGRKVKQLRSGGSVPANVFGKDVKSTNIQLQEKEVAHFLAQAGESTLVYLQIEGEKDERPVMIAEVRQHPVSGSILHVGLRQVNLKEKTTSMVPVKLVGEAPAEAEKIGILVQQLSEVEVEALPTDIPEELELDISGLKQVDDAVYVKDLKVDSKLTIVSDVEGLVAKIEPLAAEEPVEAPAAAEGEAAEGAETTETTEASEGETKKEEEPQGE